VATSMGPSHRAIAQSTRRGGVGRQSATFVLVSANSAAPMLATGSFQVLHIENVICAMSRLRLVGG